MPEEKLKTLLCMILSVNKMYLFFGLQFSFITLEYTKWRVQADKGQE